MGILEAHLAKQGGFIANGRMSLADIALVAVRPSMVLDAVRPAGTPCRPRSLHGDAGNAGGGEVSGGGNALTAVGSQAGRLETTKARRGGPGGLLKLQKAGEAS